MPRLPVDEIDVLVVDELGKNISGTGMDTNVIGRMYQFGTPEPDAPNCGIIAVHVRSPLLQRPMTPLPCLTCWTSLFLSSFLFFWPFWFWFSSSSLFFSCTTTITIFSSSICLTPHLVTALGQGITEASHGNATGMGLADVVSEGFYQQLDFSSTATNIITSNNLVRSPLSLCCRPFL